MSTVGVARGTQLISTKVDDWQVKMRGFRV